MKNILVTGGAGYIGSHTVISLIEAGYCPYIIDNLSNSKGSVIGRLENITKKKIKFSELDLRDYKKLKNLAKNNEFDAVIHFAALKSVGESVELPLNYYENNLLSLINTLKMVSEFNIRKFIFSSSATVYGTPERVPLKEDMKLSATNPYGQTKLMGEQIVKDVFNSIEGTAVLLRYFNPIGAHASGEIGEDPNGIPNNLLPYISQVAVGKLEKLTIHGADYATKDGTGVRDYIHVMDLAEGHVAALEKNKTGTMVYNLGTGTGYSVLDMIKTFENVSGKRIPYAIGPRRAGDIAECFADPTLAEKELNWKARRNLVNMCEDAWRWQNNSVNLDKV